MKRLFIICVALIAFAATNASGTSYQPADQLQTCYQLQHPIVLLPALNVAEYAFEAPAANVIGLITPKNWKVLGVFKPSVYHNPDYGRCSSSRFLFMNYRQSIQIQLQNKDIGKLPKIKLPTQFVQLE